MALSQTSGATPFGEVFAKGVAVATRDPRQCTDGLFPVETQAIARAGIKRQREFCAGRQAARAAMSALGRPPAAVLRGRDRAPVWPEGIVGSIAHCNDFCIAAVARPDTCAAIGVDVEPDSPMPVELWREICTNAELTRLQAMPASLRGRHVKLIFCAKEAAYKCQYMITREMFDFDRFEIEFNPDASGFCAIFTSETGVFPVKYVLQGRYEAENGHILTSVTLPEAELSTLGDKSDQKGARQ